MSKPHKLRRNIECLPRLKHLFWCTFESKSDCYCTNTVYVRKNTKRMKRDLSGFHMTRTKLCACRHVVYEVWECHPWVAICWQSWVEMVWNIMYLFFYAIIYIKYDLHDIAFFLFFLNATISFFFSTLCFCALDFTWQVAQEHVRCWKQVPRKWFRQIHSGSDLTGDRTCHKLSVTLATRRLGKHTGIVQFCFFFKKGKGCIF